MKNNAENVREKIDKKHHIHITWSIIFTKNTYVQISNPFQLHHSYLRKTTAVLKCFLIHRTNISLANFTSLRKGTESLHNLQINRSQIHTRVWPVYKYKKCRTENREHTGNYSDNLWLGLRLQHNEGSGVLSAPGGRHCKTIWPVWTGKSHES